MYYLIEGFKAAERRLPDEPVRTQAVTIHQLSGAIIHMLESKDINLVAVTSINEETFRFFYLERRGNGGQQASTK